METGLGILVAIVGIGLLIALWKILKLFIWSIFNPRRRCASCGTQMHVHPVYGLICHRCNLRTHDGKRY